MKLVIQDSYSPCFFQNVFKTSWCLILSLSNDISNKGNGRSGIDKTCQIKSIIQYTRIWHTGTSFCFIKSITAVLSLSLTPTTCCSIFFGSFSPEQATGWFKNFSIKTKCFAIDGWKHLNAARRTKLVIASAHVRNLWTRRNAAFYNFREQFYVTDKHRSRKPG